MCEERSKQSECFMEEPGMETKISNKQDFASSQPMGSTLEGNRTSRQDSVNPEASTPSVRPWAKCFNLYV